MPRRGVNLVRRGPVPTNASPALRVAQALLFRSNSGITKLLEAYTRGAGAGYLRATLGPCVRAMIDSRASCEVDPTRCTEPSELRRNLTRLIGHLTDLWYVGDVI